MLPWLLAALAGTATLAAEPVPTCRLADCLPAIEAFPPAPCAGQPIPRDVRRRVRQVRNVVQAEVDGRPTGPHPARAVLKWLHRATRVTSAAIAEGKLTGDCADVLQGMLRNARACASCPALRDTPAGDVELLPS